MTRHENKHANERQDIRGDVRAGIPPPGDVVTIHTPPERLQTPLSQEALAAALESLERATQQRSWVARFPVSAAGDAARALWVADATRAGGPTISHAGGNSAGRAVPLLALAILELEAQRLELRDVNAGDSTLDQAITLAQEAIVNAVVFAAVDPLGAELQALRSRASELNIRPRRILPDEMSNETEGLATSTDTPKPETPAAENPATEEEQAP